MLRKISNPHSIGYLKPLKANGRVLFFPHPSSPNTWLSTCLPNRLRCRFFFSLLTVKDAQFMIGYFFEKGIGTAVNLEQAFENYSLAAAGGHVLGQIFLGRCYENGIGTEKNEELSRLWATLGTRAKVKQTNFLSVFFFYCLLE